MRGARGIAAEVNVKQPFKFFAKQTYAGILAAIVFLISENSRLICQWNAACLYSNVIADYVIWGCVTLIALLLLVGIIIAAIKGFQGQIYKLPVVGKFADQYSG